MYCGSWKVDDLLTFDCATHTASTGAATDADGAPAYRVYEDETTTPILTGTMALLDGSNTAGFYSEQITLSAANGFEKGKRYTIYISAAVAGVTGVTTRNFQMEAEVDANVVSGGVNVTQISGDSTAADNLEQAYDDAVGAVPWHGIIDQGTAQAAGATTIQLRSAASFGDDTVIGATVFAFGSDQGYWQVQVITDYVSSTDTATVPGWTVTPSGTITYKVFGSAAGQGVAQTGDAYAIVNSGTFGNAAIKTALDGLITTIGAAAAGVASAVWSAATRLLTAGTNIVLDKGTGITGFNDLSAAQVNAEVDTALADIHLDHLLATTYDPASKPGAADALLNELVESDAGVARYTANALEQAPTGGSAPTAGEIADEVRVELTTELGRIDAAVSTRATPAQVATELGTYDGPTNAELATALATADDAVLAAIAALNNLSSAQAQTAAAAALTAYDPPTNAEMEVRTFTAAIIAKLTAHAGGVLTGVVGVGSTTTAVVFNSSTGINGTTPSATNDFYTGRVIIFLSGALAGQATSISDYVGSTVTATVVALTGVPSAADTFIVV